MGEEKRICSVCGEYHPVSDMELSFRRPDRICEMPEAEREAECQESDDICVIRREHFFVRGVLPLPIPGGNQPYRIGLWVELNEEDFRRVLELWEEPAQAHEAPFAVRIANHIPQLPETLGLCASLRLTGPATRPDVLVGDPEHPLHVEQLNGISRDRIDEYNHLF